MAVGDAFLSAFLQVLFDRLASPELLKIAQIWRVDVELKKLKGTLLKIQAVLNDAELKQVWNNAVRIWLEDLKHLAYDVEDIVDEFEIEALRWKLEAEPQFDPTQVWSLIPFSPRVVSFRFAVLSKINKIMEKLEEIARGRKDLGLKEKTERNTYGISQRPATSSLVNKSRIVGREADKQKLVDLLLSNDTSEGEVCRNGDKVFIIPVSGMGGIGKTTIAQLVYNEERVIQQFELKAWVCVSEEFDLMRVTRSILESATGRSSDLKDLGQLQVSLKKVLRGKRFLIVLDNVWNENYNNWDDLMVPLRAGAQGSKVIVTTRSEAVSLMVGSIPSYNLDGLTYEDCWSLMALHAFAGKSSSAYANLEAIGKEIVKKCGRLPLVAKALGGLLRNKVLDSEWEDILNSEIWNLLDEKNDILPSLRLSYYHLPAHLKPCFAYCSIFPKGYELDKENLVLLWMAEGFVQQKQKKQIEDIGREYFDELFSRSFFQKSCSNASSFVMHDLINDLARNISGDISFRLNDASDIKSLCRISEKVRHASYIRSPYDGMTKFEAFYEAKSLRTFLPLDVQQRYFACSLPHKVQSNLFPVLKCLRVLSLRWYNMTEFPDSISNLKHLRYLDLSHTNIVRLPESMSTLYSLQSLMLIDCYHLTGLVDNMGNLIHLRHLDTRGSFKLQKMPVGIDNLTSLQTLSSFVVGENGSSRIRDLRDMSNLRGKLCILKLENVADIIDVVEANIKNKEHLHELELAWGYHENNANSQDRGFDENVLDELRPHWNIKELTIKSYDGARFPSWMGDPLLSNLARLELIGCTKCESLPSLGLLPSLRNLVIDGMHGVKRMGHEFYGDGCSLQPFQSLETLMLDNMLELEEWSSGVEESGVREFPRLHELTIWNCPNLRRLSPRFPALTNLEIRYCEKLDSLKRLPSVGNSVDGGELPCLHQLSILGCPKLRELPDCFSSLLRLEIYKCSELSSLPRLPLLCELDLEECDGTILRSVVDLMSLTSLHISGISNLVCLPEGMFKNLASLEELKIVDCSELMAFPREVSLQLLTSLKRLLIWNCPRISSLPDGEEEELPSELETLEIMDCNNIERLQKGLCNLRNLEDLRIVNVPKVESLPEGLHDLTSLESLIIEGCPSLTSLAEMGLPAVLKRLVIRKCGNLKALPAMILHTLSLEHLEISGCSSLKSFPSSGSGLPANVMLKEFVIKDCVNLESLPEDLHSLIYLDRLIIERCPCLVSFPGMTNTTITNLRTMSIVQCGNLVALPHSMHKLSSLQHLRITGCPRIVSLPEGGMPMNLKTLTILDCENLKPQFEWGLHKLMSLCHFTLGGCPGLSSFPEWLLPSTLSSLCIKKLTNLNSLSERLRNLKSLESFVVEECHRLKSLPEEGLPHFLSRLVIRNCPLLKRQCQMEIGRHWHKIAHISYIEIDNRVIH